MILEHAVLTIKTGGESAFEAIFSQAVAHLAASEGYISHALQRSIESPNRYALFVQWQRLEDHTQGFRGSAAFTQWRALIGPYSESPPTVEHYSLVAKST